MQILNDIRDYHYYGDQDAYNRLVNDYQLHPLTGAYAGWNSVYLQPGGGSSNTARIIFRETKNGIVGKY